MRDNDGFVSGMMTGVALGALVVLAVSPQVRRPVMQGATQIGSRMRNMWRRGDMMENVQQMMPDMTQ